MLGDEVYHYAYEQGYNACLKKYAWMLEGLLYQEDIERLKK